jgi:uncharacterized protein YggE
METPVQRTRHLLLALVAAASVAAPAHAQTEPRDGISVEGAASREVPNDTGRFGVAVGAERRTATRALRASSRATRRVLTALEELGIERADLETGSVTLRKVFARDRRTKRMRVVGYHARNDIRATVRDLALVGRAIDAAVAAGATGIGSLFLFPGDVEAAYREVLGEALDAARAKAEVLAARAGVTLGRARVIVEGDGFADGFEDRRALPDSGEVPIRPGQTTVEAFVSVVFDIS